ncbi:MAG: SDR family NAD(P)-dependent oxidoreductase [Bacteroidales bacterium]|nr:SDR family NAD(P)-dependent oxidoreductase [Bacteroidales bacterium]
MKQDQHKQYQNPLKAIITGISDLFRKNDKVGELKSTDRLDGKNILVTGASSGLGYAIAVQLAERGSTVIMACRSGIPDKGEEIRLKTGSEKISMLYVDLSDIESIDHLVKQIKELFGTLDIVICNAGIVSRKSRLTMQGFEQMFMVNYLSNFLLINLLFDQKIIPVYGASIPRIIFTSSESHRNPHAFDWENFGTYTPFTINRTMELYGYDKLLLTTFACELSHRLNSTEKTICSVFAYCPGPVNSNIAREAPAVFKPLLKLIFTLFFHSPDKAAEPAVYLATSQDEEGKDIDYLFLMSRRKMDEKATDHGNGQRLWNLSEKLLRDKISFISLPSDE